MMEQGKILNVAIVGGGPACKAIMDMIFAEGLSRLRMKLIGVADLNPTLVSYCYAREKGIYTTKDYHDLYRLKDLDMLIELTGRDEVADEIFRTRPSHVQLMSNVVAHLFWNIFQIVEEGAAERKRLETKLSQAQKMEAIGTLTSGIAHDFNNVLMGMQGPTSLMLMNIDSDHPHFEHLHGIEDMVRRGADLTKQLLGFARVVGYEVKPTDLNMLIKKSSQMFGRTRKEINIHRKYQKDLWKVEVDRGQIEQVLLNLFVNAWQAMCTCADAAAGSPHLSPPAMLLRNARQAGGRDLYLQTENVVLDEKYIKLFSVNPGNYVKVSVTDTGTGMDKEIQRRIFEPFFTTKEKNEGTGLGLASAYGIIKNHGGLINVHSEKGKGAAFNIYLPATSAKSRAQSAENGMQTEFTRGAETILLVDDEDVIVDVGEKMLKAIGYKVLLAGSGKKAIEVYRENKRRIDMVILDMIMPDIGGGEVYDTLKEINPGIKVLLSSGYSMNSQAAEILKRSCDGFIQKPFSMKQLSQSIRQIMDKK